MQVATVPVLDAVRVLLVGITTLLLAVVNHSTTTGAMATRTISPHNRIVKTTVVLEVKMLNLF